MKRNETSLAAIQHFVSDSSHVHCTVLDTRTRTYVHVLASRQRALRTARSHAHRNTKLSLHGIGGGTAILLVLRTRLRGGWSRFSRNAHLIIAHHRQCIVFADSAGWPGLRGRTLQPMKNAF